MVSIRSGLPVGQWVITDLGALGDSSSVAWAINDSGVVVGESTDEGGYISRAFLWENGEMADLGTLTGYVYAHARAINKGVW